MIDAHCHLNFHSFEEDYDAVIAEAKKAGVHTIINTGTQVSSSKWAVDLAEKYERLYAVIGVHPHHADKVTTMHPEEQGWIAELEKLAKHPKVIGIGECGIDYYSYQSNGIVNPAIQEAIFIQQLELAHSQKLPLQIHTRTDEARKVTLAILKAHKHLLLDVPGMFHCMAGSLESLYQALDLGFSVGFDGNTTYAGTPPGEPLPLTDLIEKTPLERLVIETDSPYLTPMPDRGKRNTPASAILTARFIARIKNVSFEEIVEQTDKNVYTIFNL